VDILSLLVKLSSNIIENDLLDELLKSQPEEIKHAIKSNDIKKFKSCISNKQIFANEVKVTTY